MRTRRHLLLALATAVGSLTLLLASESSARADDTIKHPGDHPEYHLELEPHGDLGWYHQYTNADLGFGLGARFSIPIVQNGFIPSLNNNVGISFGIDFLHYTGCYYRYFAYNVGCEINYLMFPIALQWNFFIAERWSVGAEPGLYIYHAFYDDSYCNVRGLPPGYCGYPTSTGANVAFFIVGRYHFSEKVSLTMRLGFPYVSVGASFFL